MQAHLNTQQRCLVTDATPSKCSDQHKRKFYTHSIHIHNLVCIWSDMHSIFNHVISVDWSKTVATSFDASNVIPHTCANSALIFTSHSNQNYADLSQCFHVATQSLGAPVCIRTLCLFVKRRQHVTIFSCVNLTRGCDDQTIQRTTS